MRDLESYNVFQNSFHLTITLWKDYDQANIEEIMEYYKADLLIESIVERRAFDILSTDS